MAALHKAAVKGQRAVCEWLLSAEVGLSRVHLSADGDGNTPSLMARLEGHHGLAAYQHQAVKALASAHTSDRQVPGLWGHS